MYAIVDIAGQQFKVERDQKVVVHRLKEEEGAQIELNKVLLIDNNGIISVGEPVLDGACIAAKILSHIKGEKVKVFKKKRRKGYKVLKGHRQYLTVILIQDIYEKGAERKIYTEEKSVVPEENAQKDVDVKEKEITETKKNKTLIKKPVAKKTEEKADPKETVKKKPAAKKETKGKKKSE